MVERLCAAYGTRLATDDRIAAMRKATAEKKKNTPNKKNQTPSEDAAAAAAAAAGTPASATAAGGVELLGSPSDGTPAPAAAAVGGGGGGEEGAQQEEGEPLGDFYAFPTVQQLSAATDEALREMGFGRGRPLTPLTVISRRFNSSLVSKAPLTTNARL